MNSPDKGDDKLQRLTFQGDVLFHQKQWQQALQAYQRVLEMIPKRMRNNSAVHRLVLESVTRCHVHLKNGRLAEESALQMVAYSQNDDQKMTSQSLLATVYEQFDNPQGKMYLHLGIASKSKHQLTTGTLVEPAWFLLCKTVDHASARVLAVDWQLGFEVIPYRFL
ncbi:uncharacterized protein [Amphiura filiformis]|uniref:uncharacterized protein n=1 Tax=Amphiura filiformis TaxID=82378 RepID=UPI003B228998